ncbi:Uncharacterised protein [Mycobacteroides abscessus subsp. abscessus]|uniref:hypothetical protein n=1 Tax=Mycobacteroides abscessus TaxID=36809 RepID=UPI00092A2898|nr:hypothetical protein [Mycobacteroides abscessus]SIJ95444.1 Uncharacterised protein [Mycobacteroides abscessus subsp. abscessus]
MSVIETTAPMMLLEVFELESRLLDDLEELVGDDSPIAVNNRCFLQTLLTQVQERIGHLTTLLTF